MAALYFEPRRGRELKYSGYEKLLEQMGLSVNGQLGVQVFSSLAPL